jgi:hypothetical protein
VGKTKSGMIKGEGGFCCIKGKFVKGSSVSDPYSFYPDPDPAFEAEYLPIRIIQGFNDQKIGKNLQLKIKIK